MKRRGLLAAAALVVVANAIALVGVARNRASTLQTIDLTERELPLGYQGEENSGIDLHLAINYEPGVGWFDAAKLKEMGFPAADLSRPVYVALEYDGPGWQAFAAKERETTVAASVILGQSRLIPVDASRSPDALLTKYGSTGRHLIVRGAVKPGQFVVVINPQIHVPLPAAVVLQDPPSPQPGVTEGPRYTIRLAYGTHFEPWVVSVTALPK